MLEARPQAHVALNHSTNAVDDSKSLFYRLSIALFCLKWITDLSPISFVSSMLESLALSAITPSSD